MSKWIDPNSINVHLLSPLPHTVEDKIARGLILLTYYHILIIYNEAIDIILFLKILVWSSNSTKRLSSMCRMHIKAIFDLVPFSRTYVDFWSSFFLSK